MNLSICLVFLVSVASALAAPIKILNSECPAMANQVTPFFQAGYCFSNNRASVQVYGSDGRFAFTLAPRLPGDSAIFISDVAVNPGVGFVVAASSGAVAGIVQFDRNGTQNTFFPISGFEPDHVAISADHSIWVVADYGSTPSDHMLVYRYSATGKLLGSYLPFSTFPPGTLNPIMHGLDTSIITGGGIVVVTARSGPGSNTANLRELIRMDNNGNVLSRTRFDYVNEGILALTADGVLYRCDNKPPAPLYRFIPGTQTWQSVPKPVGNSALFGAEEDNLVYRIYDNSSNVVLQWYAPPALN